MYLYEYDSDMDKFTPIIKNEKTILCSNETYDKLLKFISKLCIEYIIYNPSVYIFYLIDIEIGCNLFLYLPAGKTKYFVCIVDTCMSIMEIFKSLQIPICRDLNVQFRTIKDIFTGRRKFRKLVHKSNMIDVECKKLFNKLHKFSWC